MEKTWRKIVQKLENNGQTLYKMNKSCTKTEQNKAKTVKKWKQWQKLKMDKWKKEKKKEKKKSP